MIDRVELIPIHEPDQVGEFHGADSGRLENPSDACREVVDVRHVGEHIVPDEEVGLAIEVIGEPAVVVDPEPQRVDIVFRARPVAGADPAAATPSSPEIVTVAWFAPDALPDLQHETVGALAALARIEAGDAPPDSRRTG